MTKAPHPLDNYQEEELKEFAANLLKNALKHIEEAQNVAGACWRIADALGSLSFLAPEAMGVGSYTGLGFKLDVIKSDVEKTADEKAAD